ncbi:MAG: hypothetical protein NC548_54555, partial [Lachnospiraceae bacterium]|nr:hypothetical protein [Lachnospiraceae bacterium]
MNAVVHAPIVSTDAYGVRLRRLSFAERSGFRVDDISGDFYLSNDSLAISDLTFILPHTSLEFEDIIAEIDTIADVPQIGRRYPVRLGIKEGSHISLSDFRAFSPALAEMDVDANIELQASGVADSLCVETLRIYDPGAGIDISARGCVKGLERPKDARLSGFEVEAEADCMRILSNLYRAKARISSRGAEMLKEAGVANVWGSLDGGMEGLEFDISLLSDIAEAHAKGFCSYIGETLTYDAEVDIPSAKLGTLLGNEEFGEATAMASSSAKLDMRRLKRINNPTIRELSHGAKALVSIERLEYRGHEYSAIIVTAQADRGQAQASITSETPGARIGIFAEAADAGEGLTTASLHGNIYDFSPAKLGLADKAGSRRATAHIDAEAMWKGMEGIDATLELGDIAFADTTGRQLRLGDIYIHADNLSAGINSIEIESEILNGSLQGRYDLRTLAKDLTRTLGGAMPILADNETMASEAPKVFAIGGQDNDFHFEFTVDNARQAGEFFRLPVYLDDPVTISGDYDGHASMINLDVDAPIFINGNKLVRNTLAHAEINGANGRINTYLTSLFPTKKGDMQIDAYIDGIDGSLSTKVDWEILREKPINGQLNFNTSFARNEAGKVSTRVGLRHSTINFGDALWTIMPYADDLGAEEKTGQKSIVAGKVESVIEYDGEALRVSDFVMQTPQGPQSIKIDGKASSSADDHLVVEMDNIQMLHIFETLDIDKALICGSATGTVDVSALFSKTPQIKSTQFNVTGIGYNGCVLGDADVKLGFNMERGSFDFLADITSEEGRKSVIDGWITPANEGISLKFNADRVKVGFMKPFVSAFCSDIEGYASGKAELFGTFKYINMRGDLLAQDLRMKIEYTNTWYSATDSLHLTPGLIKLDNITLHDGQGGSATLNGRVTHHYFKRAGFDFDISVNPGKPMLCYNIPHTPENPDQRWYGEIYGQAPSSVNVHGIPGDERTPGHVD